MNSRSGLTLVELAIVLVVIGLVTGGVLVGRDMIRASELRAVSNEYSMYVNAVQNFRAKYSAIPGDMKNATSFWGDNNTYCPDAAITNGTPGTCNGNGNAQMEYGSAATATGEIFQFWTQLSYAGFVGGYYSGIAGPISSIDAVIGTNSPDSKVTGGGWNIRYLGNWVGDLNRYALNYGNFLMFGGDSSTNTGTSLPILTPADAYSIDQKLDDGKPATGMVIGMYWNNLCAAADDGSSANDDLAASYRITDTAPQCALLFVRVF